MGSILGSHEGGKTRREAPLLRFGAPKIRNPDPYSYFPNSFLKLSEKSRTHLQRVALRATETVLFGPFWRSYTGQIYGWGVAPTPFRTVSEFAFSETREVQNV